MYNPSPKSAKDFRRTFTFAKTTKTETWCLCFHDLPIALSLLAGQSDSYHSTGSKNNENMCHFQQLHTRSSNNQKQRAPTALLAQSVSSSSVRKQWWNCTPLSVCSITSTSAPIEQLASTSRTNSAVTIGCNLRYLVDLWAKYMIAMLTWRGKFHDPIHIVGVEFWLYSLETESLGRLGKASKKKIDFF